MESSLLTEPVAEHIWRTRYQWREDGHMQEPSISATWERVALAVSNAEAHHRDEWRERFHSILRDFRFLPGGCILAAAGTTRSTTQFNGFVMGPIDDSIQGIFNALRESMVTLQARGGIGVDFSTLRPAGSAALSSGTVACGPVPFMTIWEAASAVLEAGNVRRGAIAAALRCDHPDIEAFVDAKGAGGSLSHFSLSALITDDFMRAVEQDEAWALVFPLGSQPIPVGGEVCERVWSGASAPQLCRVHRRIPARGLWDRIVQAQHASGQPRVLFIDRINRANNLWYCEHISAANPSGEAPLPAYGGCNLGAINLSRFVRQPFGGHSKVDFDALRAVACIATRFLDNVHDVSVFPLKSQEKTVHASRRIGLGVTGLADMFLMLGLRYGSPASLDLTRNIMSTIRDYAYRTSIEIAREKGPFPAFDKVSYGASPFVLELSHELQDGIAQHGIRNSHLLAIAPAVSVSLLANCVSAGIDPISGFETQRSVPGADGEPVIFTVQDYAWRQFRAMLGAVPEGLNYLVQQVDVDAECQLNMMAAIQPFVDNAIAKSVSLPSNATPRDLDMVLLRAWELGLKACAVCRGAV